MKPCARPFVLFFVFALLLFNTDQNSYVSAQQQSAKSACPVTKVTCPDMGYTNDKLQFTANVTGGDPNVTPTYNWSVSSGSIESGQGTSTIEVSTKELSDNETITATVELGGFPRDCGYGQVAASCTSMVSKNPEARKLGEYGTVTPKQEADNLDKFTIELQMDPTAQAYIIAYGGRASRPEAAHKAADKAKTYLVEKRGLDSSRIVTVNGGYREQPAVELWIVPSRAPLPKATPTVKK